MPFREHVFASFLQPLNPKNFTDLTLSNAWSFLVHFATLYCELFVGFAAIGLCLVLLDEAFSYRPANPADRISPGRKLVNLLVFSLVAAVAAQTLLYLPLDLEPVDLTNQRYVVTGCTPGGIGFETALILAEWNATVVCSVRTKAKGDELILEAAAALRGKRSSQGTIEFGVADLTSFASVAQFAREVLRRGRLDGLVLNAGVNYMGSRVTENGLEEMVQVNHYSGFLLARLLEERLLSSSPQPKLVFVSSTVYLFGALDRQVYAASERPQGHQVPPTWWNKHSGLFSYSDSKLFNVLTANAFAERWRRGGHSNATVNSVCPGLVMTPMLLETSLPRSLVDVLGPLLPWVARTPRQGAARPVQVLTQRKHHVSGKFWDSYMPLPMNTQVTARNADWIWAQSSELLGKWLQEPI